MLDYETSVKTQHFAKLYPEIKPFNSGKIKVSKLHELYFEECGNPKGKPVIMLHGGPGGGSSPLMRRYHNPDKYRIVLFDQRGCGRSSPNAELQENTSWDLVEDIEKIRQMLGIESWQVFGGSWGSTLALAYSETYPERVTELIVRGIFLLRRSEVEWFYQQGANYLFPDRFEAYQNHIPEDERDDMIAAYYRRLTDENAEIRLKAARLWSVWEGSTISLLTDSKRENEFAKDNFAEAFARIECHYFHHGGFFEYDGWLLDNAVRLNTIPGVIVHGRYDVVTPLINAWELSQKWTRAHLQIISACGHAMTEPGIIDALIRATDKFS